MRLSTVTGFIEWKWQEVRTLVGRGGEWFWGGKKRNSPWVKNKTTFYVRLVDLQWNAVHLEYEHETLPSYVSSLHCIFLHKKSSRTSLDLCGGGLLLDGHTVHSVQCWSHQQTHHWMLHHCLMGFQLSRDKQHQQFKSLLVPPWFSLLNWSCYGTLRQENG